MYVRFVMFIMEIPWWMGMNRNDGDQNECEFLYT